MRRAVCRKAMTFITHSTEETVALGMSIGAKLRAGDVIAMQGALAAGKTTITKGIAAALGVNETITSPTFCLISEYAGAALPLYHMDVYRLDGVEDFANTGASDLLYGSGVCIIEWSEKIMEELPKHTIVLRLEAVGESSRDRKITLENWRYGELA